MKAFASLLALFATAATTAAVFAGTASADPQAVAYADLNGDHRIDRVTVQPAPDNPNQQILVGRVGSTNFVTRVQLDSVGEGVLPLHVVDLDHDGRQEVVVTEVVGANTLWYTVWGLSNGNGWQPLRTTDGTPFYLYDGGGISAINRYGCTEVHGHRELVVLSAFIQDPWDDEIYAGTLDSYTVHNGVATPASSTVVAGHRGTLTAMAIPSYCV
jgi:hypothetical protein